MSPFKVLTALLIPVALSACATPQTRVRNGLTGLGLAYPVADCMAERMVDRLSLSQLNRLSSLDAFKALKSCAANTERVFERYVERLER